MADHSHIEWTDATWNPITGCSVVSPGCTNCYAMRLAGTRLRRHPSRQGLTQASKAGPVWTGEVRLNADWLDQPLRWRKPRRIFVCAHGDLFHESVPDEWIDKVFAVMTLAPQHTFQVLTKRAARMRQYIDKRAGTWVLALSRAINASGLGQWADRPGRPMPRWPLPNVWLGVSAEDQPRADERIPDLMRTPAAVRFVSLEPLVGPIDLTSLCDGWSFYDAAVGLRYSDPPVDEPGYSEPCERLDWVIVGGENGDRPMHPAWPRMIRKACEDGGVPFFFKQWGSWAPEAETSGVHPDACYTSDGAPRWPGRAIGDLGDFLPMAAQKSAFMRKCGKAAAGRTLDGRTHDAMPDVRP